MTLPIDPLAALLDHLRADPDLTALIDDRLYGLDRPRDAAGAALTATLRGGVARPGLPLADLRVEIRCWGGTGPDGPQRAIAVWRACRAAVNISHRAVGQTHLLWCLEDGGPLLLRDPDSDEAFARAELRLATADAALLP
ncbi:MAG: DUF3168 domain-containing protein [Chloroflexi bacterium]|nr:DUF3168 domain-containing protein [Chloroflexota bacterium]